MHEALNLALEVELPVRSTAAKRCELRMNQEAIGPRGTRRYESKAADYLANAQKTLGLLQRAQTKGENTGALRSVWEDFQLLSRMIRAYVEGTYREVPWKTVLVGTAAVIYFVVPTDFIPDFLLGLGLMDDAAVLAWTVAVVREGLEDFRAWEKRVSKPESTD